MIEALVLGLNLATHHFDRSQNFCETNLGIYALHRESRIAGGVYHNSECRTSAWLARQWDAGPYSLSVGGVTGYRRAAVLPLVVPSVKAGPVRLALLLAGKKGGGLHLSIETSF